MYADPLRRGISGFVATALAPEGVVGCAVERSPRAAPTSAVCAVSGYFWVIHGAPMYVCVGSNGFQWRVTLSCLEMLKPSVTCSTVMKCHVTQKQDFRQRGIAANICVREQYECLLCDDVCVCTKLTVLNTGHYGVLQHAQALTHRVPLCPRQVRRW